MGLFDRSSKDKRGTSIARADELRAKASKAADNNEVERASELYFLAAEHYRKAHERYWEKHCESWGWSTKARAFREGSIEESLKSAEYYDNSIQADNSALQCIPKDDPSYSITEGNLRFTEGDKYTSLANVEVEKANATAGNKKADHLRRAAGFRLSGAQTMKLAAEISKRDKSMANYYNRLGISCRDKSGGHYYKGSAEKELDNWIAALNEFEKAREEREKAIELHKKSLKIRSDKSVKNNLKQDKVWLKTLKKELSRIRKEADAERKSMQAAAETGKPRLDVTLRAVEGMVQNLVSTLSITVVNAGDGIARDISVRLESPFFEGENIAALGSLPPGVTTYAGLSVVPLRAGKPKANLVIMYLDGGNRQFRQKESAMLRVADPEARRPPPMTILNVTGDYLAEGASKVDIRDSVVQRSNIGKDISVKKGIDEGEFKKTMDEHDEKSEERASKLGKGQKELREDVRRLKVKMRRHFNYLSKDLPYPYDMRKKRGTLIMEFRCAICEGEVGTIRDRLWTRWLHYGLGSAMIGIGFGALRPEVGIKGLKKLYSDLAGKPMDDLPRDRLFLTQEERDNMVTRLRQEGILDELNYCPECDKWVCGECFDSNEEICNEHMW